MGLVNISVALRLVSANNFLKACYAKMNEIIKFFIFALVLLSCWNYIMVFYPRLLLAVMPWWCPLVVDFALGIMAFYALFCSMIELIKK